MKKSEALNTLGLAQGASEEDIKKAHRKLIIENHPDKFGQDEQARAKAEEKTKLILNNRLALFDVIANCTISGSADASVKEVTPNDLTPILQTARIGRIFVNGKTAEKYYLKYLAEKTGMPCICLPSTSAANASFSLEKLIAAWQVLNM